MIKLDYLFSDEKILGSEHGLNINQEFLDYKDVIAGIVEDLYNKKGVLFYTPLIYSIASSFALETPSIDPIASSNTETSPTT